MDGLKSGWPNHRRHRSVGGLDLRTQRYPGLPTTHSGHQNKRTCGARCLRTPSRIVMGLDAISITSIFNTRNLRATMSARPFCRLFVSELHPLHWK